MITLSLAIVSITIIKFVLNPVEPTAPTIIPAVAIAIPTATMLIAPFWRPTIVWLYQSIKPVLKSGFLIISLSFLAPEYVLSKFYPKFNEQKLSAETIQNLSFDPAKEVHIKVTRVSEYGERYKLFVIDKRKFE